MGWAFCGTDSEGREIGYGVEATCDHPECSEKIDRGLGYACGGMHLEGEYSCEKYFCGDHLNVVVTTEGQVISICDECYSRLEIDNEGNILNLKEE